LFYSTSFENIPVLANLKWPEKMVLAYVNIKIGILDERSKIIKQRCFKERWGGGEGDLPMV
jgi:hypothetical protein